VHAVLSGTALAVQVIPPIVTQFSIA